MEREDRIQRLKDIEWFFKALPKWAVDPSEYRKAHQTSILSGLSAVRSQLSALLEDANQEEEPKMSEAERYNRAMDERNKIAFENREKPWLPFHDGE